MEAKDVEANAWRWFFGSGLAALLLSLFIVWIDMSLSTSTVEQEKAEDLRQLRMAQSGQYSRSSDERIFLPFLK